MVNLRDIVRDTITGYQGVVIGLTTWLNGCVRVTVQAQELKDGKPVESYCIDEPQLEIITKYEAPASAPVLAKTGGPIPTPKRRADVSR